MTSKISTPLDEAHAAVEADPENDAARLRFYERLADGEMYLLLEKESEGDTLEPKVFTLDDGDFVLVFDDESRLADFTGGIAPWAALPGRVIAGLLKGQGIGLGVNLGVAPSSMLLPAEAMDWLAQTLEGDPEEGEANVAGFAAHQAPEALRGAILDKLAHAAGLAAKAVLAQARYSDGHEGLVLAFIGANEAAEAGLARMTREALVFSGVEDQPLDVLFLAPDAPILPVLLQMGEVFDLPEPQRAEAPVAHRPQAPGMDPNKPPKLH